MLAKETHRVEEIGPMIEEEAEQVLKKLNWRRYQIGGAHANYNDLSGSIGQW